MVVWQGARLAAAGIALGLVGAAFAARAVQSLLFVGARGYDPIPFIAASVMLAAAALAASYIPARRAARVAPITALGR